MLGHICLAEAGGHRPLAAQEVVLNLPLLRVSVPQRGGMGERALCGRVRKGARLLAESGVRRVLTAPDFPCWDLLAEWGLRPVDPVPLCQAMAQPLALALLAGKSILPEHAIVSLQGQRVTHSFFGAALDLAPRVRALMIAAPVGGQELARHLRSACGLPVVEEGPSLVPDIVLRFSPLPTPAENALHLYGAGPDLAGLELRPPWQNLPAEFAALPLLAALWEEGRLAAGELVVSRGT